MKTTLLFSLLSLLPLIAICQYRTVVFDYERSSFNENQPLPAESNFLVTGSINPDIELVEVRIYDPGKAGHNDVLAKFVWKRSYGNEKETFTVPINYKLDGNTEYDFEINYYSYIEAGQREKVREELHKALDAYIDQSITIKRNRIALDRSYKTVLEDMNSIVNDGFRMYKNKVNFNFGGFSGLIENKLRDIDGKSLKEGPVYYADAEDEERAKLLYARKQIDELKILVKNEANQVIGSDLLYVVDSRRVNSYPTEKTSNYLALNIGYGGIYNSGGVDNLSYDTAPFAGVSIPFGKRALNSMFWSNTSISLGVFLQNINDGEGRTVTGPLVNLPSYAGLGYKIFRIIRLNAGVSFLELQSDQSSATNFSQVYIRPFVGASLELNIWVGADRKK